MPWAPPTLTPRPSHDFARIRVHAPGDRPAPARPGPARRRPRAADQLTLLLDWFVNPDHAPIIVADERGYFADAGLEVEIIAPADPNDPPKLVAAGQADIAISYQPQLHIQVDQGLPLARIGTLVATPLNSLVVLEDGPIDEIADLAGPQGRLLGRRLRGRAAAARCWPGTA